jgi:hypothetical protein
MSAKSLVANVTRWILVLNEMLLLAATIMSFPTRVGGSGENKRFEQRGHVELVRSEAIEEIAATAAHVEQAGFAEEP